MRLVIETDPGVIELNWMWLPTWIGHNAEFKEEVEVHINTWLTNQGELLLNDETLDRMHDEVLSFIGNKFPEPVGLTEFIGAMRLVHDAPGQEG